VDLAYSCHLRIYSRFGRHNYCVDGLSFAKSTQYCIAKVYGMTYFCMSHY
jgi:hypothetical protein